LNGQELNFFVGADFVLALGGGTSLRSGGPTIREARGHVRGSITQGFFLDVVLQFRRLRGGMCGEALRRAPFSFVSFLLGEQKKRKRHFGTNLGL
jgi:hypothetical protein